MGQVLHGRLALLRLDQGHSMSEPIIVNTDNGNPYAASQKRAQDVPGDAPLPPARQ
jgi:hypothetical protein